MQILCLALLLFGCIGCAPLKGSGTSATPPVLSEAVSFEAIVERLMQQPHSVAGVYQHHNLDVVLRLQNGSFMKARAPDIDVVFQVLDRCAASCAHIGRLTE